MTNEIRTEIENIMNEICGGNWWDEDFTEAMCESVCERCPYCGRCAEMGIMWGCPNWEQSMGEDL